MDGHLMLSADLGPRESHELHQILRNRIGLIERFHEQDACCNNFIQFRDGHKDLLSTNVYVYCIDYL